VIVYRFDGADPNAPTLSEVDRENTGRFTGYMAVHPNRQIIYTADSTDNWIRAFAVAADGTLTLLQTMPTGGTFPLGIDVSPDGTKLYGGGGISNSGNKVVGYLLAGDGTLTQMAGSPFISPGASPKLARFSPDSSILYVAHGTDATVRSFLIDSESGALTSTGFSFDVGLQGSHGDHVTLDEMLLITDDTTAIDGLRGLYSFDRLADGDFTMNGAIVDTQGVGPTEIAGWTPPPCVGDFDGDKTVGLSDLAVMLGAFGTCSGDPGYVAAADLDGSGCVDLVDLSTLLGVFGSTC